MMKQLKEKMIQELIEATSTNEEIRIDRELKNGDIDRLRFIVENVFEYKDLIEIYGSDGVHIISLVDDVEYIEDEGGYLIKGEYCNTYVYI